MEMQAFFVFLTGFRFSFRRSAIILLFDSTTQDSILVGIIGILNRLEGSVLCLCLLPGQHIQSDIETYTILFHDCVYRVVSTLGQTCQWSYSRHNTIFPQLPYLKTWRLLQYHRMYNMQSLECTYGTPLTGVLVLHHDHKASFLCFIKINHSLNCAIIYPEEVAVIMAPENYIHNDAGSTCTSASCCDIGHSSTSLELV